MNNSNALLIVALVIIAIGAGARVLTKDPTFNAVGMILIGIGGFLFLFARFRKPKEKGSKDE